MEKRYKCTFFFFNNDTIILYGANEQIERNNLTQVTNLRNVSVSLAISFYRSSASE